MAIEDWIDGHECPDKGNEPDVECRKCGKAGLHWGQESDSETWQLYDGNFKKHKCNQAQLDKRAAADFEDLDK